MAGNDVVERKIRKVLRSIPTGSVLVVCERLGEYILRRITPRRKIVYHPLSSLDKKDIENIVDNYKEKAGEVGFVSDKKALSDKDIKRDGSIDGIKITILLPVTEEKRVSSFFDSPFSNIPYSDSHSSSYTESSFSYGCIKAVFLYGSLSSVFLREYAVRHSIAFPMILNQSDPLSELVKKHPSVRDSLIKSLDDMES